MKMKWMTKSKIGFVLSVVVVLLLVPRLLLAHHNHQVITNYDYLVAVTGVVTQHVFTNPHAQIHVTATDDHGGTEEWIGFGANPGMETRIGYSAHMFNVGTERITMYGFAQKDGRKIMVYRKLVRANGEDIPIYQTGEADMSAFLEQHNLNSFKEIPSTLIHCVGGQPYKASDGTN